MVTRRRPNGAHYAKISKGARNATLGTHVSFPHSPEIDFAGGRRNARKNLATNRRASVRHGEINQVLPSTSSRESERAFQNRISQRAYTERIEKKTHRRTVLAIVLAAAAVVLLACAVAVFVFVSGVDGRLKIDDEAVAAALADPTDDDGAYYALVTGTYAYSEADEDYLDALMLVRVDAADGAATMLSIPGSVLVTLSDGKTHRIGEAAAYGGDAEAINAVEALTGVQLAHYARIDGAGVAALIDELGGLTVTLPQEIDDPNAGSMYLPSGTQTLSGEQVLYALRAANLNGSTEARAENIALLTESLVRKAASGGMIDAVLRTDRLSNAIRCDVGLLDFASLVREAAKIPSSNILYGIVPTTASTSSGVEVRTLDGAMMAAMMENVRAGANPAVDTSQIIDAVDKTSFTIAVRNGTSIAGAAGQASDMLTGAGFTVEEVGNTEAAVYDETLVIYADPAKAECAEAVSATLGAGRVVNNSVHYVYTTDVLVVIGKDWESVKE